ncbi:hypothetical protein GLOIN_2v1473570 [Rhizophagus clarus]|uniref:Uncharacterized protein n=1 Tax=Rhizophagus clarus TaxID=94130 RepID=A0A8H3QB97_9GLOM|nr:hypothetical protein GLOIN_2v1473570 [Rhizophagus clarus]
MEETRTIVEFLREASNQKNNTREAKELGVLKRQFMYDDRKKKEIPSTYDKYYIRNTEQSNKKIYGWSLGSLNINKTFSTNVFNVGGNERYGCRIESEKYEKYENNETSGYCPANATRIKSLQRVLGELCRISAVGSTIGTRWGPCRFLYPHLHVRKGGRLELMHKMLEGNGLDGLCRSCSSSPMVVEVIANEYKRNVFAFYINHGHCEVSNINCIEPGSNLDYIDEVQEYGFNHIISLESVNMLE